MSPWFLLLSLAQITPPPSGPYHVEGSRILDRTGHEYLIRGTTLPPVTLDPSTLERSAGFGPFSRTTLITLRQRMNMNAVRIPIDEEAYKSPKYRAFVKQLVKKANEMELLAIVESAAPAADLKSSPNVFFAIPDMTAVTAIRSTGAQQPIILNCPPSKPSPDCKGGDADPNIIYEIQSLPSDWNPSTPLLVNGLDPHLTEPGEPCSAFPPTPAQPPN